MTADEGRIDKALDALSRARTALDDPSGLPEDESDGDLVNNPHGLKEYAIDQIDDAMRLLNIEKPEPKFGLMVCRDGVSITRPFDAEEEAIDAIGAAMIAKEKVPDSVITVVVGRV